MQLIMPSFATQMVSFFAVLFKFVGAFHDPTGQVLPVKQYQTNIFLRFCK